MVNQPAVFVNRNPKKMPLKSLSNNLDLLTNHDDIHNINKHVAKEEVKMLKQPAFSEDLSLSFIAMRGFPEGHDSCLEEKPESLPSRHQILDYLGLQSARDSLITSKSVHNCETWGNFETMRRNCPVPLSSPLGSLWLKSTGRGKLKNPGKILKYIEKYCRCSYYPPNRQVNGMVTSSHDTSSSNSGPLIPSNSGWSHLYCFNKQQRKEKVKQWNADSNVNLRTLKVEVEKLNILHLSSVDLKVFRPLRVFVQRLGIVDDNINADARRCLQMCRPLKVEVERLDIN